MEQTEKNEKQTDMINDLRIITNIGTSFKLEEIITISEEVTIFFTILIISKK